MNSSFSEGGYLVTSTELNIFCTHEGEDSTETDNCGTAKRTEQTVIIRTNGI